MASWTDQPLTANSFRPYVQQIPVEAEISVGMQKQRQYDEGYQKIQSQIDRVAGLSIMRDVDKKYLQSKMSQLENNLRIVSMGDLSNYQLVNSIGGMVNQVGKDKYIQSAVTSTARVQKELNTMETLRKEGKSDKNNEEYFYEKMLNPYLSAGLKDEKGNPVSFSGSFSPYVDITDEVRKLAKDAGIDEDVVEMMYETDVNGKIKFKDGKAVPARTLTELTTSSNAKAIEGILNTVLDRGDVQNQMNIDAWANTRGVDAAKMLEGYKNTFNESLSSIDNEIVRLKTLLSGKISSVEKEDVEREIKKLDVQKTKYKKQLEELITLGQNNPDGFKEKMYKTNYENSLRDIFIKTKRQEKNLQSPLTQQLNWEKKFDLDYSSEMFDRGMDVKKYNLELEKLNREWIWDPSTNSWIKNDGKAKPSPNYDGRMSADNPGEYTKTAVEKNDERLSILNTRSYNTGFKLMYDVYRRSGFPTATSERLFQKDIEKEALQAGISPEQYVYKWIKELDINAKVRGVQLAPRDRELATAYLKDRSDYTDQMAVTKEIDDDIKKEFKIDMNSYLPELIPSSVTLSNGRSLSFTKEDMLNYITYDFDKSTKNKVDAIYGDKEGLKTHIQSIIALKYGYTIPGASGDPRDEYSRKNANIEQTSEWKSIEKVMNKTSLNLRKAMDARELKFKEIFPDDENIVLNSGATDEERKYAKQRVADFVQSNSNLYGKDFDRKKILSALNASDTKITFVGGAPSVEGVEWKGEIIVNDDGVDRHIVIEKQSDLETLANAKFKPFKYNKYLAIARTSDTHSTNKGADVTDENAYITAKFSPEMLNKQLPADSKYIFLGADLNLMADEKTWCPVIYLKDKTSGKILNVHSDRTYLVNTEDLAIRDIANLTSPAIEKIVKDNNTR